MSDTTALPCPVRCSNTARMQIMDIAPYENFQVDIACDECGHRVHMAERFTAFSDLLTDGFIGTAQLTEFLEGYDYFDESEYKSFTVVVTYGPGRVSYGTLFADATEGALRLADTDCFTRLTNLTVKVKTDPATELVDDPGSLPDWRFDDGAITDWIADGRAPQTPHVFYDFD